MRQDSNGSKPTVSFGIEGLSVCCYNKRKNRWEMAFLRCPDHALRMTVTRGDKPKDSMMFDLPNDLKKIEIKTRYGLKPDQFVIGTYGDKFDRRAQNNDPKDFGWIVDFTSDNIGHGKAKLKERPDVDVTLATFKNATFYTKQRNDHPLLLVPFDEDCKNIKKFDNDKTLFGVTAKVVGADISTQIDGKVTIKFGNQKVVLPYVQGVTHLVEITNMEGECEVSPDRLSPDGKYGKGDFHQYYKVFDVTGDKKSMWGSRKNGDVKAYSASNDVDCNTVSGSELPSLEQLVQDND